VRIDSGTLTVTSADAKVYVDSPILGPDGTPVPDASAAGMANYYYIGDYPGLDWPTTDLSTGLEVGTSTSLPAAPFPLVAPTADDFPASTMSAGRYFQVDPATGSPMMVGEMDVDVPWYNGDVPFFMGFDPTLGLTLDYAAPADTPSVALPGDSSVTFYGMYWVSTNDGTIVQAACLGVPPQLFNLVGLHDSDCYLSATVTFSNVPSTAGEEAHVSQVTIGFKTPKAGQVGTPQFNLASLTGQIDLDPVTQRVTEVELSPDFGVGPPTPCQLTKNAAAASKTALTTAQKAQGVGCPSNYFFFDAQLQYTQGSTSPTNSFGVEFDGSLSFENEINLNNVEVDVQTSPFNFHFADSPIDVSVDVGVPLAAQVTLSGDVSSTGFDITLSGSISVMGNTIASASGAMSTLGFGLCGSLAGQSIGVGDLWGEAPSFYPSGCTITQYEVGT
jgi:hypothetical protein